MTMVITKTSAFWIGSAAAAVSAVLPPLLTLLLWFFSKMDFSPSLLFLLGFVLWLVAIPVSIIAGFYLAARSWWSLFFISVGLFSFIVYGGEFLPHQ